MDEVERNLSTKYILKQRINTKYNPKIKSKTLRCTLSLKIKQFSEWLMITFRAYIFSNCVEKIKAIFPFYVLLHYDAQVCVTMKYFSMIGQFLFTERNKN